VIRALLVLSFILGAGPALAQALRVEAYYSPTTDLEQVDVTTLTSALGRPVNFAAYVLTDYKIINTLARLGRSGSRVRVYLDPSEVRRLPLNAEHPLVRLARTPNVEVRVKSPVGKLMHLKRYSIGGMIIRTGSANLSIDGLKHQDNDVVLIHSREIAARFDAEFESIWNRHDNLVLGLQ
jgi:phosphatidylserine/phosphatidylglycerophosphate/cardiolipin synthase-like enzyme